MIADIILGACVLALLSDVAYLRQEIVKLGGTPKGIGASKAVLALVLGLALILVLLSMSGVSS